MSHSSPLSESDKQRVISALDTFKIETPSWGYADTGTRFGKFLQDAAAVDIFDKIADAAEVNRLTGCCPTMAIHADWDITPEVTPEKLTAEASAQGVKIGSINPNLFQDQQFKFGSLAAPSAEARALAIEKSKKSVELARAVDSPLISFWLADGTNYPGQDSIVARKERLEASLQAIHATLTPEQVMLIEYKPFEPAFYTTDIADWGMALHFSRKAGPQAKILVDTGHHLQGQNIEHIVAFLLSEGMLGGFHFNDRRYADDDLTLGSIDPYQIFRIFNEICDHHFRTGAWPEIAYMIDQSHNLKPKVEAMVQTVVRAQELFAKAALVDREALAKAQAECDIVTAEDLLQKAFYADVSPIISAWREARSVPADPIAALKASGYIAKRGQEREDKRKQLGISAGSSYA